MHTWYNVVPLFSFFKLFELDNSIVYAYRFTTICSKDLRVITGASIGGDGGKASSGGGAGGAVTEGAGTYVVQKFVKSKGPHAFIIRQVYMSQE